MTERTTKPFAFSTSGRQCVEADFTGGQVTSDAGLLLLREADKQLGLIDLLNDAIPDPRNPALITHPQRTMLAQRIFGIASGYEDLNDHDRLRDDPVWQVLADHPDPTLASSPTLCRLENRVDRDALVRMSKALVEAFIQSHVCAAEYLVLDLDATDFEIHGHQENRFFHGYYDKYCFLPLYITCGTRLLVAYLRPARNDAARHARAVIKLLVKRLRQVWPNVKIILRGDSGYCRWKLMRWCDRNDVRYLFGLARNSVLQELAGPLSNGLAALHERDGRSYRAYDVVSYAAATWDRPRRVIVKAEQLGGKNAKSNPRFVVTNLAGDSRELYERWYCERGNMENRIKEQYQLYAARVSCHYFMANQFRVLLAAAAYVLVEHVRRVGLAGTEMATAEVGTIRVRLFKIGGWVQRSVRRVMVRMSSSYVGRELFETVWKRLTSGVREPIASG